MPRLNAVLGLAIAATLIAGCQLIPQNQAPPSSPTRAVTYAPRPGLAAPDFRLPTPAGKQVGLSDFRGRPVVVNFWATWCGPCRIEMPDIEAVYQANKERGLIVLAVNVQEPGPAAQNYGDTLRLTFPILLDEDGELVELYSVNSLPTTFFIDRQGVIQEFSVGALSRDALEKRLAKIL